MNNNLAVDMAYNQCNVFDFNTFIDNSEENRNAIIAKLGKSNAIEEEKNNILNSMALMYLENKHKYRTEKEFWQWLNQNRKGINKINNQTNNNNEVDAIISDGGINNNSSNNYKNNIKIIPVDNDTPEDVVIAKSEETPHKENAELEETSDSKIEVIDLRKIIINWLDGTKNKTEEWEKIKKWAINALNTDNIETRKHAIILSKMTDRQREVWIVIDYYDINQIGKSNQVTIADYVSMVTGNHITRQSLKLLIIRAATEAGIDLTSIKGFTTKPKQNKKTNVILITDFIKQHKQLDFNLNHQESKIGVTNNKKILLYASKAVFELKNKAVNGYSSGYSGKESVFSPSANGLNTATYHGNISSNNIDLNNLKINNKKTSSESKILSINAFIEKNVNSKTNSDNNTFCQVISINQGIHHSDQSPFIFNKKSIHRDKPVFKKDKWSSDMFARYGP